MINYIVEIDRAEAYKKYGTDGNVEIFGKVKKIEDKSIQDISTVYICVKRNTSEPVYILTETETRYGFDTKPEFSYVKHNANGKCIGESLEITRVNKDSIICNNVNWFKEPINKRKVLELCKSKKENC